MWVVERKSTHANIVDQMPAFGGLNIPFHLGIFTRMAEGRGYTASPSGSGLASAPVLAGALPQTHEREGKQNQWLIPVAGELLKSTACVRGQGSSL
jgi:hypothetical protein